MPKTYAKGREDHYLPQGYLRGFIDPGTPKTESQPLWVFDIQHRTWRRRSTSQVGWQEGFYDFVYRQGERAHAESAFTELENGFPSLIEKLRGTGFRDWRQHSTFLLRYLEMIRCRSPLFREQFMREWSQKRGARVIGVHGNEVQVDSLKLRHFSPGALKEGSINAMLEQMNKGSAVLETFYWQVLISDSIGDSFITCDHPLMMWSPENESFDHRSAVMMFPLCWEACLMGRRDPLSLNFDFTDRRQRESIRKTYFASARKFIVSPRRLF